jgi:hypothetical protein
MNDLIIRIAVKYSRLPVRCDHQCTQLILGVGSHIYTYRADITATHAIRPSVGENIRADVVRVRGVGEGTVGIECQCAVGQAYWPGAKLITPRERWG